METKDLSSLNDNPKNPRTISTHDFDALKQSIQEFGDLSCIVFNLTTQRLVGGHQRRRAFEALTGEKKIIIRERYPAPNKQGTVAIGYIVYDNEMYPYREVQWDEAKELEANIAANRIQGEWDEDLLAEVNQEILELGGELTITGQTDEEIEELLKATGPDQEPTDPAKTDDGMKSLHAKFSDEQLAMVYEAIGLMKRQRTLTGEFNSDLDANALYYIAKYYVEHVENATSQNIETNEQVVPTPEPAQDIAPGTPLDQIPSDIAA